MQFFVGLVDKQHLLLVFVRSLEVHDKPLEVCLYCALYATVWAANRVKSAERIRAVDAG